MKLSKTLAKASLLIAIAMTTPASASPDEPNVYEVPFNRTGGGSIPSFANHLIELNKAETLVKIQQGCVSACTFYLAAKNVCVGANTPFHFHGPSSMTSLILPLPVTMMTKAKHKKYTDAMAELYNIRWPGLGDWFLERAAHKAGLWTTEVKGQSLSDAFGVPICEDE